MTPAVLTWHVHGSYLYYLSQANLRIYLPVNNERSDGYGGRSPSFPWPDNVVEVDVSQVPGLDLDCIIFQSRRNYEEDQYAILSTNQRGLPGIYIEHDPPQEHPTNTRHWVDDPEILLVHVTHFNRLMWDSGATPTTVIDHGVKVPSDVRYSGEVPRGIVVVNNLPRRGRRLGLDIFEDVARRLPVDLAGMGSEQLGGLGDLSREELFATAARYRFFFNPIRYTSLGLSVCEAMMLGLPVVALATTEIVTVVENGVSGYLDTDLDALVGHMSFLIDHPDEARRLGQGARRRAEERFNIERFSRDWEAVINDRIRARPASRLIELKGAG